MKKYLVFIIIVIFTFFLIALSCAQPGGGGGSSGGGSSKKKSTPSAPNGYIFAGGTEVDTFGFIDLNENGILDDGDPVANLNFITIDGNQTSIFTFPDDFEIPITPPNSGSINIELSGADAYNGNTFYLASLAFEAYPPTINSAEINAGSTPLLPLQLDGITQIFYGGADVPICAFIDINDNEILDNLDLFFSIDVSINGNMLDGMDVGLLEEVSGCGSIS